MSIFIAAILLVFTACTKEEIIIETETNTSLQARSIMEDQVNDVSNSNGTVEITVTKISSQETSSELQVDFSSNDDLTSVVLEGIQQLIFADANGDQVALTFDVNDFTGGNASLQVNFALDRNDLTGLTLESLQDIVIEDVIVN